MEMNRGHDDKIDKCGYLLYGGGLFNLLVLNKGGLLVVHLGPRKFHDPAVDLGVARSVSHGYTFFQNEY